MSQNSTVRVRIDRVVTEADMRKTRALVFDTPGIYRGLSRGHTVLLVNRACTMARLIDCEHGLHTYYAPPDETFDVDGILNMMRDKILSIGVQVLTLHDRVVPKRSAALSVPKREAA
jgi:hypothetical protein